MKFNSAIVEADFVQSGPSEVLCFCAFSLFAATSEWTLMESLGGADQDAVWFKQKSFADEVIEFVASKSLEAEENGGKRLKSVHKVNEVMMLHTSLCHQLKLKCFKT